MDLSFDAIFVVFGVMMLPLVEQELFTLPEYLRSPRLLVGFVLLDLLLVVYALYIVVCPFVLFLLASEISVLRYTDSDYPFDILKLFIQQNIQLELCSTTSMTYRQIRNKTKVTRQVPPLQQKLLTQLEQPSSSSCFVEFALPKP